MSRPKRHHPKADGRRKPLYRKVNTRTHGVRHGDGGEARWDRHTKRGDDPSVWRTMHKTHRHGLDYTPLFRFLLSKVGEDWDAVRQEATARLDTDDPIGWMVAEAPADPADEPAIVRTGPTSFFSRLYVDPDHRLAIVDPTVTHATMAPTCACCTHTLNGKRLTRPFAPADPDLPDA